MAVNVNSLCKASSELWILWSFNSGIVNAFWTLSATLIHILPSFSGEQPAICAHINRMLQSRNHSGLHMTATTS
jgi:hypothetical protein